MSSIKEIRDYHLNKNCNHKDEIQRIIIKIVFHLYKNFLNFNDLEVSSSFVSSGNVNIFNAISEDEFYFIDEHLNFNPDYFNHESLNEIRKDFNIYFFIDDEKNWEINISIKLFNFE